VIVEYALRDSTKPMRVAQCRISPALPAQLQEDLPTVEDVAREFPLMSIVKLRSSRAPTGLTRDGRVASFNSPSIPFATKRRRRQRRTVSRLWSAAAAIPSAVNPSLASNTIRALQTTFCGVFRSRTNRSNRSRSDALIPICSIFLIDADSQVRADL
jgi:hypothetical protein